MKSNLVLALNSLFFAASLATFQSGPVQAKTTIKSAAKVATKECWLLTQINPQSPYSQSQIVFIGAEGICLSADDVKMFLPAPKYEISVYNSTSKQYYHAPLDTWLSRYGALPFSKTHKYMSKAFTGKIAGIPAQQAFMMQGEGNKAVKLREIWSTDAVEATEKVQHILQHMCGVPEGSVSGIPLRVIRLEAGGKREVLLNTMVAKKIPTPKDAFKQPTGYKKVNSELTLLLRYGKKNALNDLFEGTTDSRK